MDYDKEIEEIMGMLPNMDENKIREALIETGDVASAVHKITHPRSPSLRNKKRTIIKAHINCGDLAFKGIKDAVTSLRSCDIEKSEVCPPSTISIFYQGLPLQPMIYVEPEPLDQSLFSNILTHSIILTQNYESIEIKLWASFYGIVVLPYTKENTTAAVKHVLIENGVIGDGFPIKSKNDLWNEMLNQIPMIKSTYANSISQVLPNPYAVSHNCPSTIISKGGNKIPERVINNLKLFFSTDDPNETIKTTPARRKGPDD